VSDGCWPKRHTMIFESNLFPIEVCMGLFNFDPVEQLGERCLGYQMLFAHGFRCYPS